MIKILGSLGTVFIQGGILGSLFFVLTSFILPGFPMVALIITLIYSSNEKATKIIQWVSVASIIFFVIIVKALGGNLP